MYAQIIHQQSPERNAGYRWNSWRIPGGVRTEIAPEIGDRSFQWSLDVPRGTVKYTAKLNEAGQWEETGEFSPDGKVWRPVFGMLLYRVK